MKKINFTAHVLPHAVAIASFLLVTVLFFKPFFFDKKVISQHDIQQFEGSAKTVIDYRDQTGEEALWVNSMFSGMPAYMVSVIWSNGPVSILKKVIGLGISHPVANIFCAFVCYYILLLSFGVRPYLAIGGALAFGLSSYMIIGLSAGHNARIGAIAFMPLAMAGIHLALSGKKILGFGLTAAGLALQLRENHIQITYYLAMIIMVYGLIQLILAIREKKIADFSKTIVILIVAVVLATGTYFGQFWAITEYSKFSIRGPSELVKPGETASRSGLSKEYAFDYNYGIYEPVTLLIPGLYGGSSMHLFAQDQKSNSYQALVQSSDNQLANQLMNYTSAYWGPQRSGTAGPYYAGAIVVFLFVIGILFADKKYVWWLVSLSVLSIMLSWGDSFSSFNYFIFDYLPGYNKFRSVNFALVIILFAMPLLGLIGVEKLLTDGITKEAKRKLLIAFSVTGGLSLIILLFAGLGSFEREGESQLPAWFLDALRDDRKSLLRGDAFRSLAFIFSIFILLYLNVPKRISPAIFYALLAILLTIDIAVVDKRYFTENNFRRKRENVFQVPTEADAAILEDKSYYRVYNMPPQDPRGAFTEARTSYFHHSIGGYHGAKMRRYQDLYDSCFYRETIELLTDARTGKLNLRNYSTMNMLNIKYIVYGPERNNIVFNSQANGNAWFVRDVESVKSPTEELAKTCDINTRHTAVIDESKFNVPSFSFDSAATIRLIDQTPKKLTYESEASTPGLAVFSEIYYPEGWKATIDGTPAEILRANYVLRALAIPQGKHSIEFKFEPAAYHVGNKVTMASSWIVLLVLVGCIGWTFYKGD